MTNRYSSVLCILALGLAVALPSAAQAVTAPATGTTTDSAVTDQPSDTAPLTLTPDEVTAMQDAASGESDDKGALEKASDFVTDNAPFFIIGIIVIAAVLAGIFILRGRPGRNGRAPKPPRSARAGTPADAPSASELRRRKRAAVQRNREEERLRRKAGVASRRAGVTPDITGYPGAAPLDPVQAEKLGAQSQQQAAEAAARTGGPIAAPYTPTQNAPAPGVVIPGQSEYQTQIRPQTVSQPFEPPMPQATPAAPGSPPPVDAPPMPAAAAAAEPALEAPGLDATVGNAAAAFAAAAAGGSIAGHAAASRQEPVGEPAAAAPDIAPAAAEVAGAPAPVIDDRLQAKLDELKAGQAGPGLAPTPAAQPPALTGQRLPDRSDSDAIGEELSAPDEPSAPVADELSPGLAAVERRLSADQVERDRTLQEAEDRLRRIEQRAEDAERRAAFAERLAQLKVEESERERRLQDVVSGIDRAEQRASEAEARAIAAEQAAASALEQPTAPRANVPDEISAAAARIDPEPAGSRASAPEQQEPAEDEPTPEPARKELFGSSTRGPSPMPGSPEPTRSGPADGVDLNSATFEELRGLDLSVTQATRVLAYRERFGGYRAVEDLAKVPGFPPELIESLRTRFTV